MFEKEDIQIDLSGLPQDSKGEIQWKKCIGEYIPFMYNNEIDHLRVVGYYKYQVTLELNNRIRRFHVKDIYSNNIGPLLDIYTYKFKYNVGDIIGDFEILEQMMIEKESKSVTENALHYKRQARGYKVRCTVCNKIMEIEQSKIERMKHKK